jgi:hypothetical protein
MHSRNFEVAMPGGKIVLLMCVLSWRLLLPLRKVPICIVTKAADRVRYHWFARVADVL